MCTLSYESRLKTTDLQRLELRRLRMDLVDCYNNCIWSSQYTVQFIFGRPFVKRFALCYRSVVCLSCLSVCPVCRVCNVGVLWPNGWTDQDETWHAGRPRPRPHCVRWGPSPPNFRPISVAAKWLHGSRCHLVWR